MLFLHSVSKMATNNPFTAGGERDEDSETQPFLDLITSTERTSHTGDEAREGLRFSNADVTIVPFQDLASPVSGECKLKRAWEDAGEGSVITVKNMIRTPVVFFAFILATKCRNKNILFLCL